MVSFDFVVAFDWRSPADQSVFRLTLNYRSLTLTAQFRGATVTERSKLTIKMLSAQWQAPEHYAAGRIVSFQMRP